MKLKKIASLMLAGIMAVSMLAACGEGKGNENPGSSSSTVTENKTLTDAVLDESKDYISNNVGAYVDEDLSKAMSYLATSETVAKFETMVTRVGGGSNNQLYTSAAKIMPSKYTYIPATGWGSVNAANTADQTWWGLYVVNGSKDDNYVAKEVADILDSLTGFEADGSVNYDLCVMKTEVKNNNGTDATGVSTVIGIVLKADNVKV